LSKGLPKFGVIHVFKQAALNKKFPVLQLMQVDAVPEQVLQDVLQGLQVRSPVSPNWPLEHVATQEELLKKLRDPQVIQLDALVEQVRQELSQFWQVWSVVLPHFPAGQVAMQVFESRNVVTQEVHVKAVPEQVLQEGSQL
jgi:hypothetical protein